MVVEGADPWGAKDDGGAPVKRGWPHSRVRSAARTRVWQPTPASAAYGRRQEGGSGVSRARRGSAVDGAERDEATAVAAAGGNADAGGDLVEDGAERFSCPVAGVVTREVGGSRRGGGFGWRRGMAPAAPPPPKRRAVSSTRRLPHVSGREPAAPVVRSGDEGILRLGAAPSHGGFGTKEGFLLPAVQEKVLAAKGGASAADWYPHGTKAMVGNDSVGYAGFLDFKRAGGFFGTRSCQLGRKHLETPVHGQELEEGEIGNTTLAVHGQELEEGEIAVTMDNVEDMNHNVLNGQVEGHKLDEGATMDNVGVMAKEDLDGPVEGHELEEGLIATNTGIVVALNKDALYGSVESQEELEEGEIACSLDTVDAMNQDTLDGAVEVQELEQGVSAATMDTVESTNNQALHAVVRVQDLEESECAAMDIVEGTDKDTFVGSMEDRELEDEIAAKMHGQETDDLEIARNTDHTVQHSQLSADVILRDSTGGIMKRNLTLAFGKTVQPPVNANDMLDRPCSSRSATTIGPDSTSALASKENRKFGIVFVTEEILKDRRRAEYLKDDDMLMAVTVHEGKLELCRCVCRHGPHEGGQNAADRRFRIKMICKRFRFLCRFLTEAKKQEWINIWRVDSAADQAIRKLPDFIKYGSSVGEVDGVKVGDEFVYRAELTLAGLHSPNRAGIDATKDTDGEIIAVSIVASGGYLDEYSSSGELTYIGSGGKAGGNDQDGDQKLERGNLALKNCIDRDVPVRVTHGFKIPNNEEGGLSIGKEIPTFIYDGMYHVVAFWQEGIPGSRVFKYRLRRIDGQPELPLRVAKCLQKSVVRPR